MPATPAAEPYRFVMLNWNPMGHTPPMWPVRHFDFHLYLQPEHEVDGIRMGTCSELVHCDDFQEGIAPLPPQYDPAGYIDPHAVEGAMGAHLVDPTSPEINGGPFTRTMIYGKYDGELTFIEPMITRAYIQSLSGRRSEECRAYPQPQAFAAPGWYPRQYCVRYSPATDRYAVSLDDLRRG